MPRARKGSARRKKHKKILKAVRGHIGAASRRYRVAKQAYIRAGQHARVGRKLRKRDFRRLWITRISAACRQRGLTYSRFIHALNERGIEVNRKMLADIAVSDPAAFDKIVAAATSEASVATAEISAIIAEQPQTEADSTESPADTTEPQTDQAVEVSTAQASQEESAEQEKSVEQAEQAEQEQEKATKTTTKTAKKTVKKTTKKTTAKKSTKKTTTTKTTKKSATKAEKKEEEE